VLVAELQLAREAWRSWFTMSVISWRRHGGMSHFTVNYMDMSYLTTLLARGPQAMSSITKMSSQRYMPHYLVIRSEAPCKTPAQRRRAAILRRRGRGSTTGRENRR
jgi:hypothetical protein